MNYKAELDLIYRNTKYRILPFHYDILVDQHHAWLDMWMEAHRVDSFTILTAWNPRSEVAPRIQNLKRNQQLLKTILSTGSIVLPVLGIGPDEKWDPEMSWLVTNLQKGQSLALARDYDQHAIVCGFRNQKAEIIYA